MEEYERDQLIVEIADAMINYNWRLLDLVSNFGYSLTTVYKWITFELKFIDDDKYCQCRRILNNHKHERWKRGGRY